jgi:hypothetical protein
MNHSGKSLLALAFCVTGGCLAQEVQPGVQAGFNLPMGDLGTAVDHRVGLQVGGHVGLYYGNGHELRPRIDYCNYQGGWTPAGGTFSRNTVSSWQIGCDYLYYTETRPIGVYLTGGLGYQWWNVAPDNAPSHNTSGLSMAFGAGYRFNRSFSGEARFTTGQFQSTNGQASALQLMATMRF